MKGGAAVALGVLGAGADVLAFGVDATSFVADGMVASLSPDTTMGREAEERLVETMGALSDTWDIISENPEEVATQLAKGAGEVVVGAARGDAASQTKLTSFVAQSLNAGSAARSTARSTGRATAKSVAEVGEQAAKRADEAVAALNASNRARRSAQQSTTSPKPRTATPQAVGRTATPQKCFVAGTPVWTSTGMVPIEEVQIGDRVWSRSEETGELRLQPVVELFVTPEKEVLELQLVSSSGVVETLGVTQEHPFYVLDEGWVTAGRLRAGDRVWTARDAWLEVRQVRGSPEKQTVFNFEVEEDHSYFVGENQAWVHNICEAGKQRVLDNIARSRAARQAATVRRNIAESRRAREARTLASGAGRGPDGPSNTLQKIFEIKQGKGNFGIGKLSAEEASSLGRAFVGDGAVEILDRSTGAAIGVRSADSLRIFRFPALKSRGLAAGRRQANIEEFFINESGKKVQVRNAHIDVD